MDRGIPRDVFRLSNLTVLLVVIGSCCLYGEFGATGFADAEKLRFCVVESVHTAKRINKICPKLRTEEGNQVECVIVNDRLNCLRRLSAGDAEFAVLEPEDLVAASANTEYDVLVTQELRLFKNDTQRFAMVALVSGDIKSPSDLMGKRFCHGGLENSDDSTQIFSMGETGAKWGKDDARTGQNGVPQPRRAYFQNWIIPRRCDSDKTLVQNKIAALSGFFDSACVPGAWSRDLAYDFQLKSKYRNLCALCENPAGCYNSDKYHGREGALLCLTENAADAAWVRLDDALRHFKTQGINETKYSYLCPDGTTRPVGRGRPCAWITKPWPVVVASRDVAERVAKLVATLSQRKFPWQNEVQELMESYRVTPVATETLQTPEDFFRRYPGFASANARSGCWPSRLIKWCVASNLEDRKCHWMREASLAYGLDPPISCVQQPNRTACLDALRTERADLFVVRPEEELEARLKGTERLMRVVTNKKEDLNVVAALVKNDSPYRTLEDLRGARACFTGYRSIGWNAFVDVMSNSTVNESSNCSDLRVVSNFFKDSCVPGLKGATLEGPVPSNLYSLCDQGGDGINTTAEAYTCLNSGKGDVAFVSLENGMNNKRGSSPTLGNNLRSICIDPSALEEEVCYLTWTALGSVVINENMTGLRREEIYSTLSDIDILFGKSFDGQTLSFSLYGPYNANRDIIFPERTQRLQRDTDHVRFPRNYAAVVDRFVERQRKYSHCSKAVRPAATIYSSMVAILLSVVILTAPTA